MRGQVHTIVDTTRAATDESDEQCERAMFELYELRSVFDFMRSFDVR